MKFKLIALAAVLAAACSANAAPINTGAAGNGGLFFSIWDSANSYSRNLGFTIDSFEAGLAAAGNFTASFAADATFTSFLGTANLAALKWNVVAAEGQGARRVLESFTAPKPLTTKTADILRTLAGGTQSFITDLNAKLVTADSATYAVGTVGYAGATNKFATNGAGLLNFSNAGTFANSDYVSGLSFMRINAGATGIAASTYTPYLDGTNSVKLYLDGNNALNIAVTAVPEPESFAMLLAGLGLMGAIARRRNKKSV